MNLSIKVSPAMRSQIDVDVQPMHLRVSMKKNHLQLVLPDEARSDHTVISPATTIRGSVPSSIVVGAYREPADLSLFRAG